MKPIRQGVYVLLALLSLLVSALVFPSAAQASSDYDDLLHTSPTLFVYADGATKSQKMDISESWFNDFGQTYAKRVQQNIGWPTNFMTELSAIRSSGSLGVVMHSTSNGITVEIYGTRDPDGYCGFVGDAATGVYRCVSHPGYGYVSAVYFTHNSYGGGCWGSGGDRCSNDGMNIYEAPTVQTATAGYEFLTIPNNQLPNYTFYFMDFDLTYPSGYAGEMIPTEQPRAKYVAMGDSYSSGEGNPPFEAGTATGADNCHRSPVAYPRLLDSALNLGTMAFVACSGATTSNVLNGGSADGAWGENPQIDALSADTEVVTITIGGNDVGFTDYAIACTETLCGPGTFDYDYIMDAINAPDFYLNLAATYESILTHAPNAQVYVSGYPFLATEDSDVCGQVDLTGAWAVQDQLNAVIKDAVDDVAGPIPTPRLHYVDPNQSGSPFVGKHLCNGGASDFNGLTSPTAYSFHPNADGHEDFESVFESAIS
ncbi:SGNH/GDSL hydrolase family protein [Streptomyces cynarae]|uniref:SGNH/GDSL hydrolase family protein n=1 Tax=Streptomyces cynarae TaxID=2981134 RepID=UPI00406D4A77